jgi:hypothetical protein
MPRKLRRSARSLELSEDPRRTTVGISGKNEGEIARHNIVLAAFLEQLLKDERVLALFHRWSENLGGVRVSYHCPITFDPPAHYPITFDPPAKAQEQKTGLDSFIFKKVVERCNRFWENFNQLRSQFIKETIDLVRDELDVPWPTIGVELVMAFVWNQVMSMFGARPHLRIWYEPLDPPAPDDVILNFRPNPGETLSLAEQRFESEVERVRAILSAAKALASIPQGKIPTDFQREFTEGIGKYARWLYQHRICKRSQRSVAKAYHEGHHPGSLTDSCGCLKLVRHGIKEAERLLSLSTTPPI